MDQISIVIPTRGRLDALAMTLDALAAQDLEGVTPEIVIVCSGDRAEIVRPRVERVARNHPLPIHVIERRSAGAAGARNAGVEAAASELILFLNDDTPPASADLVRRHAEVHRDRPEEWHGVLGSVAWHPQAEQTPVMHWLARTGKMNDYSGLASDGGKRPMLYAPNLSLRRSALEEVGGFDERFWRYGWEEYDLALRLADRGFRLTFMPDLVCWHYHRYTLRDSLRRMEAVGQGASLLNRVHASRPELATPAPGGAKGRLASALGPAALHASVPAWLPERLRDQLFRALHYAVLARGYLRGPLPGDDESADRAKSRDEFTPAI
jgi:GT2 family glycosyltransferase